VLLPLLLALLLLQAKDGVCDDGRFVANMTRGLSSRVLCDLGTDCRSVPCNLGSSVLCVVCACCSSVMNQPAGSCVVPLAAAASCETALLLSRHRRTGKQRLGSAQAIFLQAAMTCVARHCCHRGLRCRLALVVLLGQL
jgi:hypothetical protein